MTVPEQIANDIVNYFMAVGAEVNKTDYEFVLTKINLALANSTDDDVIKAYKQEGKL